MSVFAHDSEINSIDFNPLNEFLLISGSTDKTCALWDIRKINLKLHSFIHHNEKIMGVKWNNKLSNVFGSYSDDRRINVWDISQIGSNIARNDNEDGPSELIFTHGGHTAKINDMSWNKNDELLCASVAENNIIHLWEMNNEIYYN
jgi:histone-binding protein RBBP4